ncbi:helix-turn-helix domain-containing protein [Amorphoplanes digitatis]|uniref:Transcriptional regulator with XRE-family HTH domain n=1 Tax=Actinoplanes digitatis TaxID=1868 RepID=A0A7W7I0C5_9ACTN|nr:helix-turn-helix transcriptional regulator [Actinoplanes digitatis]MBB4764095.1 transcriptional regulator with XRE-family HTH domain [Actinoplanes digitatis]
MSDDVRIGQRIRRYRRSRGLSLDQAAGLAGISKPYLSRLERGERSLNSRALLNRISSALQVPVPDLTDQPYVPRGRAAADLRPGVTETRLALLDPSGPPRSEAEIASGVDGLDLLMNSSDPVGQARVVPDLLRWTQQSALMLGTPAAYQRVVVAAYAAVFMMRNLGEYDLAWMAAERMRAAAEHTVDPATLGFAAYAQAHALVGAGALRRARAAAYAMAQAMPVTDREGLAARGSCLLVAASTSAKLGDIDGARELVAEAGRLAERLDGPTLIARHTSFATWNVIMHRVAIEVEGGDPAAAVDAAYPLCQRPVPNRERMSYLWVDVGRAFEQLDRRPEAIEAFRRAERAAPLRVRLSPVVSRCVSELLDKSHRRAGGADLRGLAERCGVLGHS